MFALVGFILLPYIISRLGEEGYGVYQLAQSAIVFFMFLQLGMGPTLVRFFSKAIAKDDKSEIRKICSTAQFLLAGIGMLASITCLVLIPVFIKFYNIPSVYEKETVGLLICMSFSLFLNMTIIVPQGLVYGLNRYDMANIIDICSNVIRLLLIVCLFEFIRPSIFYVGLSIFFAQLFRFASLMWLALKNVGVSSVFSFSCVTKTTIRSVFGFSMLNLVNSIAGTLVFQGPVLIIGKVLGSEMVTAFAPALLISNAMQGFLGQITRPLVPMASRDFEATKGAALGKWAVGMGQVAAFVGFAIVLPLATFGPEVMRFWLGENLAWIWMLVAVMTTGVAISQVQSANYFLALGGGDIRPTVYSQVAMAVIIFIGTLLGTLYFDWHLFSIALFIGLCFFFRNTFYLAFAYSKQFGYAYFKYLWKVYGMPSIIAFSCIVLGWSIKTWMYPGSFRVLILENFFVFIAYALLCWVFLVPKTQRRKWLFAGIKKMNIANP